MSWVFIKGFSWIIVLLLLASTCSNWHPLRVVFQSGQLTYIEHNNKSHVPICLPFDACKCERCIQWLTAHRPFKDKFGVLSVKAEEGGRAIGLLRGGDGGMETESCNPGYLTWALWCCHDIYGIQLLELKRVECEWEGGERMWKVQRRKPVLWHACVEPWEKNA